MAMTTAALFRRPPVKLFAATVTPIRPQPEQAGEYPVDSVTLHPPNGCATAPETVSFLRSLHDSQSKQSLRLVPVFSFFCRAIWHTAYPVWRRFSGADRVFRNLPRFKPERDAFLRLSVPPFLSQTKPEMKYGNKDAGISNHILFSNNRIFVDCRGCLQE